MLLDFDANVDARAGILSQRSTGQLPVNHCKSHPMVGRAKHSHVLFLALLLSLLPPHSCLCNEALILSRSTMSTTQTMPAMELVDLSGTATSAAVHLPKHDPVSASSDRPTSVAPDQNHTAQILPKSRSIIVITQLSGINFVTSLSNGLLTVGLPAIASSLSLKDSLLVWPISVYSLTSGTCLLLAGTVADVLGPRLVNLIGCFFLAIFILACGLSRDGIELIMLRAMQGIASALIVPSSISIVSTAVQSGRPRNVGFACLGLSMPLGFSLGLVLGGIFVSSIGWRAGFYIGGALSAALFVIGIWALPADQHEQTENPAVRRLAREIDWVGAAIASTALAVFSYVLAVFSADVSHAKDAANIALLCFSSALVPTFIFWMRRQERHQKPVLIPNAIWKSAAFTSICIMVLLAAAVMDCMELYSNLYFQEIQETSARGASVRLLPNLLMGVLLNLTTGLIINKVPATWAVLVSSTLCAGAPLLMAVTNPGWPYWYSLFPAQLLAPLSGDVLFTVGLLVISDVFPPRTQALAGAIFNTVSQLGVSIGLTVTSVISASVTKKTHYSDKGSPEALVPGYRASFWTMFACMLLAVVVGGAGLRKLGNVGVKRD